MFHGIQIYECLTYQARHIRHSPSNTTWVYAYRGIMSSGVPVIVFRPGPWLMDIDDIRGDEIIEDLVGHAIESGSDERCGWGAVPARLRSSAAASSEVRLTRERVGATARRSASAL
jgi:signal transduction histidine kinase